MTTFAEPRTGAQGALEVGDGSALQVRYGRVRAFTEELAAPLAPEDCVIQSMPDASPIKWHLAHTTWFFETFLLKPHLHGYRELHPQYSVLFNSYYNTIGEQFCRPRRGQISRPTLREVFDYRRHVDEHVRRLLGETTRDAARAARLRPIIELGINHEQQHQELMLTDLKHLFSINPLEPAYHAGGAGGNEKARSGSAQHGSPPIEWVDFAGGVTEIGHFGAGFAYDNEGPRHRAFLEPFEISSRLVTNGEYLAFMRDGGYTTPTLWLADAWNLLKTEQWASPLYWNEQDGAWAAFTLSGRCAVDADEPVSHVSYYEADAFARWRGARLATEAEWEHAAREAGFPAAAGNLAESRCFHPAALDAAQAPDEGARRLHQMFGDVWEWTSSPYTAYPGYQPAEGALGEYNGKFMCNQMVLRGGSCATSRTHIRATYRNFFPPQARWQFMGIRLARST